MVGGWRSARAAEEGDQPIAVGPADCHGLGAHGRSPAPWRIPALVVDAHVVAAGGTNARTAQCYRCTGTNIVLRGLSMTRDDGPSSTASTGNRRAALLGREPA